MKNGILSRLAYIFCLSALSMLSVLSTASMMVSMGMFARTSYAASFVNGSFEQPGLLAGWTTHGIVSQVSSGTISFAGYSYDIAAQEGNSMALLSNPGLSGGGSYTNNWISQDLVGFEGGAVSFYYNMFSTDWAGNDRFMAKFYDEHNDEIYAWETNEYAADKPIVDYGLYYSGWQLFSHDFGTYTGPLTMSMNIKLASGSGVDDNWNTWTYLDNFTIEAPTLVELEKFEAVPQDHRILINWRTLSEIDTAGFNLWRRESEDGEYTKINPWTIEATGGAILGADYFYTDDIAKGDTAISDKAKAETAKPESRYYYKLEDINNEGVSTFHGPVSVTISVTTN